MFFDKDLPGFENLEGRSIACSDWLQPSSLATFKKRGLKPLTTSLFIFFKTLSYTFMLFEIRPLGFILLDSYELSSFLVFCGIKP